MLRKLEGLRRVRKSKFLTQQQLADSAGLTKATVVRLEKLQVSGRDTTIQKLAGALRVPPEEIVHKEGSVVPLGRPQMAAVGLAVILERDVQKAQHLRSDELWESTLQRAARAYMRIRELKERGEALPDDILDRYEAVIGACLDRPPKVRNDRADALLREIELEPA